MKYKPIKIDPFYMLQGLDIKTETESSPIPVIRANRYPDEDLLNFRLLVIKKLKEIQTDYELIKATLTRQHELGGKGSLTFKLSDDANDILTKEDIAGLAKKREKHIEQLKDALNRIENKTYGVCRITGNLIPKERLKNIPHTLLCVDTMLETPYLN